MGTIWRRAALAAIVAGVLALSACSKDTSPPVAASGGTAGSSSSIAASSPSGTAAAAATPGVPARFAGYDDPVYAKGENWLCGPGAATDDRCLRADLDATVVKADGSTEVKRSTPAANPTFDCFYVYPTVNLTAGPGNDDSMASDTAVEDTVTRAQAARFRDVCRIYAPLYRQSTLSGYSSPDRDQIQAKAYGDVHDAFKYYMSHWNQGRPMLLIGHSQGSGHLGQLLKDEFDGDPALRAQLVSAILAGGQATVPDGKAVGGSFQNIPACQAADQTGCVLGFNSTAPDTPAAELARWGAAPAGQRKLCTNPGSLSGGPGKVDAVLANQDGSYPTPWIEYPDALTAECKTTDGATTLLITQTPGDTRVPAERLASVPGWGLHISEVNLLHGSLLDIARQQGAAMASRR